MIRKVYILCFVSLCIQFLGAQSWVEIPIHIIPMPVHQELLGGKVKVNKRNLSYSIVGNTTLPIDVWADQFDKKMNLVSDGGKVEFIWTDEIKKEGYHLLITNESIKIKASDSSGHYYGFVSLMQILESDPSATLNIPTVEIKDYPRFSYRGMHLDVARHMYEVDFIKKYIHLLAYHKMNTFHWHLTEDQGWRIEIKKYPKLQTISAYRDSTLIGHYNDQPHQYDKTKYGGYYTQEEIKEIVQFASERQITIIPEIEMPGHSQAVLAAYPEYGCVDGPFSVLSKWGISDNVFCPKEETFAFLEDVIDEVVTLFPGKYIHIGGDECPKNQWNESVFCQQLMEDQGIEDTKGLQSYFIQRMEKYINSKGKQIIGWDEILEGGLADNATVMSWRGEEGGIEAAKSNHPVVMTPTSHCYFDYYQSQDIGEPLAIGGNLPLERVYAYDPIPETLDPIYHPYILGAQANVWTEYMPTSKHVEYMAYPRTCAMAEVDWTPKVDRNYDDFIERLKTHFKRLEAKEVNFANHLAEVKMVIQSSEKGNIVSFLCADKNSEIRYRSAKNKTTVVYNEPFAIVGADSIFYAAYANGVQVTKEYSKEVELNLASGKKITLGSSFSEKYGQYGPSILTNGVRANKHKFGDVEWLGIEGRNTAVIIDFGEPTLLSEIDLGFFHGPAYWIYKPESIRFSYAHDGRDWGQFHEITSIDEGIKHIPVKAAFEPIKTRYLLIDIIAKKTIPIGAEGSGHKAWLFMEEVIVR